MVDIAVLCSNRDCRVSETGKCVEGLELAQCPHYGRASVQDADQPPAPVARAGVPLHSAQKLRLLEAEATLRRSHARVVAIVGPFDAGKTSLVAGLYDLLQLGPIQRFSFAGSLSLHALERACHDARLESERGIADSERTALGQVQFYHLEIACSEAATSYAILLGDRAGEEYRLAANDAAMVASFAEIRRADTLTILVDGERLADSSSRHQVRADLLRQLQALVDSGTTNSRQGVAVVLTKLDAIRDAEDPSLALEDFAEDVAKVRRYFCTHFSAIESFQVAASPKSMAATRGEGIASLLEFWLRAQQRHPVPTTTGKVQERVFRRLTGPFEEGSRVA